MDTARSIVEAASKCSQKKGRNSDGLISRIMCLLAMRIQQRLSELSSVLMDQTNSKGNCSDRVWVWWDELGLEVIQILEK